MTITITTTVTDEQLQLILKELANNYNAVLIPHSDDFQMTIK